MKFSQFAHPVAIAFIAGFLFRGAIEGSSLLVLVVSALCLLFAARSQSSLVPDHGRAADRPHPPAGTRPDGRTT